ncbi:MAG: matrixin family metalloprotease, partial [Planctomycetota bacterium]
EIGHAIGLQHSAIDGTVMFPAALRRSGPGTGVLLPDDIARVRAVYGEGVGSVTPLFVVPEATSALLVAAVAAGLACRARRRPAG